MALYKFIESSFLEKFFEIGSLRLGTIYDFNDIVQHGTSRGDELEGQHRLIRGVDSPVTLKRNSREPILSEVFSVEGDGEASISGLSISVQRRCPDAFVFCTSHLYTEKLFLEWNRDASNVDACYEIFDPVGFINAVTKIIAHSAFFLANSNVLYTKDEIDWRSQEANANPAFTKSAAHYGWQYENRSVWGAKIPFGPLNPWVVNVPEARKFCRPFAFIEDGRITYR